MSFCVKCLLLITLNHGCSLSPLGKCVVSKRCANNSKVLILRSVSAVSQIVQIQTFQGLSPLRCINKDCFKLMGVGARGITNETRSDSTEEIDTLSLTSAQSTYKRRTTTICPAGQWIRSLWEENCSVPVICQGLKFSFWPKKLNNGFWEMGLKLNVLVLVVFKHKK